MNSESASDYSNGSDDNYTPSMESSDSSPEKFDKKTTDAKRPKRKGKNTKRQPKAKKVRTEPITVRKNHNDFFENLRDGSSKSPNRNDEHEAVSNTAQDPNSSIENVGNESFTALDESNESQHVLLKNDWNIRDVLSELKNGMLGLKRQVARLEAFIKFQKGPAHDSPDFNSRKENYVETLRSYGLPINSKEKLDEIEENLKSTAYKTKLVWIDNLHEIHS